MDTVKLTLSIERLELIKEALDTQVRLIDSYINKGPDQELRLARFRAVQREIEDILLAQ